MSGFEEVRVNDGSREYTTPAGPPAGALTKDDLPAQGGKSFGGWGISVMSRSGSAKEATERAYAERRLSQEASSKEGPPGGALVKE